MQWQTEDPQALALELFSLQQALGGRSVTLQTALSSIIALEGKDTTHDSLIAQNASDLATQGTSVAALQAEQLTQDGLIAQNISDLEALQTEQITQNDQIAANLAAVTQLLAGFLPCAKISIPGQADMNSSLSGVDIQLGAVDPNINSIPGLSVVGNTVVLGLGVYEFKLSGSVTSSGARPNLRFECFDETNSVTLESQNMPMYIRNSGGHNESGGVFTRKIYIPSNGTAVKFTSSRISTTTSAVTLLASPFSSLEFSKVG